MQNLAILDYQPGADEVTTKDGDCRVISDKAIPINRTSDNLLSINVVGVGFHETLGPELD